MSQEINSLQFIKIKISFMMMKEKKSSHSAPERLTFMCVQFIKQTQTVKIRTQPTFTYNCVRENRKDTDHIPQGNEN